MCADGPDQSDDLLEAESGRSLLLDSLSPGHQLLPPINFFYLATVIHQLAISNRLPPTFVCPVLSLLYCPMRRSIFVSAALVCLSTCGNTAKTDSALQNLMAFEETRPMLADDAVADVDVNTGKRHLLARDKDLKLADGSLDS